MKPIYLDYAATTPIHPAVLKAMLPYLTEIFGNPSSIYSCGQEAKGAVEEARDKVAALLTNPEAANFFNEPITTPAAASAKMPSV